LVCVGVCVCRCWCVFVFVWVGVCVDLHYAFYGLYSEEPFCILFVR